MRKISREELISLRDKGKVKPEDAMKALSRPKEEKKVEPKVKKREKEEVKVEPRDKSLENLTKVSINTTLALMNKLEKLTEAYTIERKGPLNTRWKLTVDRDAEKLISTIDVVAL